MNFFKKLKKIFTLFLIFSFLFIPINGRAVDGDFIWVKKLSETNTNSYFYVTIDSSDFIYATGDFSDTIDIDPDPVDTFELTSNGVKDIFVSKIDSSGDFIWAKSIGGISNDYGYSITTDSSNNVYIVGSFADTVDFDPDPVDTFELTSNGVGDIFILKLDSTGDFVWAKNIGGIGNDQVVSVSKDDQNNIYFSGTYADTVDFDPDPVDTFELTSSGDKDIFISKLDSTGDFVWARSIGNANQDNVKNISLDSDNNLYITGSFADTIDFDPDLVDTFELTSNGGDDMFIAKLNSSGDFVWAKSIGGISGEFAYALTVDINKNVYVVGYFETDTVDFDPNIGEQLVTSVGSSDTFILKLNSSGDFVWVKNIGQSNLEGYNLSTDSGGNVYMTGLVYGTADVDPSEEVYNLTTTGSNNTFILKLDSSGDFILAKIVASASYNQGSSLFNDSSDNIYISGNFVGTADFDPSGVVYNLTSDGSQDIYILKLEGSSLVDGTAPVLSESIPISATVNTTPFYTFYTDEAGTITYGGDCTSSTTNAVVGNNTINFAYLAPGTHNNCTITVTDANSNASLPLAVSSFDIVVHGGGGVLVYTTETPTQTNEEIINEPAVTITENENTENKNISVAEVSDTEISKKECAKEELLTQNMSLGAVDGLYNLYTKAIVKEVKILQAYLNKKGFDAGNVDGIIGPITQGAIKRLQSFLGIKSDGFAGELTRSLVYKSCD